jgi:uncharacterized delta-60 repeat protein
MPYCRKLAWTLFFPFACAAWSQTLDSFNPGCSDSVVAMALQPDGKTVVGGYFTNLAGAPVGCLGRLNPDGSLDTNFNAGASSYVRALVLQTDGRLVVGGDFGWLDGQYCYDLGRLYPDGSFDPSFNPGSGNSVWTLALQADGAILAGGWFNYLGGQSHVDIGRIHADGSVDNTFNSSAPIQVDCLAVQPDGRILLGGYFQGLNGSGQNFIGRLNADGSLDTNFLAVADTAVDCMFVQPDGKILLGGEFGALDGQARSHIGRLNADGSLDATFNPGAGYSVWSLALQTDGRIIVGGGFLTLAGQPRNYLGRLNADGTLDSSFNASASGAIYSMALQADGKLLVSGPFANLNGQPRNHIGRFTGLGPATQSLSCDGTNLTWLRGGTSPEAWRTTFEISSDSTNWSSLGAGTRIPGGWQLSGVAVPPGNAIRARAFTLGADYNGSSWFHETILPPLGIAAQPQSQTNNAGSTAIFTVTALGTSTLSYQWRKNGVNLVDGGNISGVHTATLVVSNVLHADAAAYAVLVTNLSGSVASAAAYLTVIDPFITTQPASQAADIGQTIAFNAEVAGSPLLSYQWSKDGVPLSGATISALLLSNCQPAQAGNYAVLVTNLYGFALSSNASLVVTSMVFTTQPVSLTNNAGTVASFSVAVTGTGRSYQWFKDGAALTDNGEVSGSQTPVLTLSNVLGADAGGYWAVASNPYASITSQVASLTVIDPIILTQPTSLAVDAGQTTNLNIGAVGTPSLAFQWWKNGAPLAGATSSSLTLANLQRADAGSAYQVVVSNSFGMVTSAVAMVSVNLAVVDGFNPGPNGSIFALAVQPDGKVLVGGTFTSLAGAARTNLARLNPDGTVDAGFNPGANNAVEAVIVQPDGKLVVAGYFTMLAGQTRNFIGRLNADGTPDLSFNPGADNWVTCLGIQADGKIVVGGFFGTLGGQPRTRIGRLNVDGSIDAGFTNGIDAWGFATANSIALQPDGKILFGGYFGSVGGQPQQNLARFNVDGTLDTNFLGAADTTVTALALQADGKILVGGYFANLDGQSALRLGRLNSDGTLDASFSPSPDGPVLSLVTQTDGRIIAAGAFNLLAGQARNGLGRLNPDGTLDFTFAPMPDNQVKAVALQTDGALLAGGYFLTLDQQPRSSLGRLANSDPASQVLTFDSSSVSWLRTGTAVEVSDALFDFTTNGIDWLNLGSGQRGAGSWQLGGLALSSQGNVRARGGTVGGFGNGSISFVQQFAGPPIIISQPAGLTNLASTVASFNVLAGWAAPFTYQWYKNGSPLTDGPTVSGSLTSTLTLSNLSGADSGSYWVQVSNTFGTNTSSLATLRVLDPAVLAQPLSRTNNAGTPATFTVLAGATPPLSYQWLKNSIALADGPNVGGAQTAALTLSNVFGADAGGYSVVLSNAFGTATSIVATLTVLDPWLVSQPVSQSLNQGQSAQLLVSAMGTAPLQYQWLKAGAVLPGATTAIFAISNAQGADAGDYRVVVSSLFGSVTSTVASVTVNLASAEAWAPLLTGGPTNTVLSLALQPDGKILSGGSFTNVDGQAFRRLARFYPDGTLDTTFNPGPNGTVFALTVQPNNKILLAGSFSSVAGVSRSSYALLYPNGVLDTNFNAGYSIGADGRPVYCMTLQPDGKILVGGSFTFIGGQYRTALARLNSDGTTDTNFNAAIGGTVAYPYTPAVYSLALQPDGKIVVGGLFTSIGGQIHNYIGRLYPNGTVDTNFNHGAAASLIPAFIYSLAIQPDGSIVAGGSFSNLVGQARTNLARLNPNGTLDSTFQPGVNGAVRALALQTDGALLLGGAFTTVNGLSRQGLARLHPDASLDLTFNPGVNSNLFTLALQANGSILVGGNFTLLAGQPRSSLGRLNNTGAAVQTLASDGANLTWSRSGTGPEAGSVTFDSSTDGINWTNLGVPGRVAGGWQLTGLLVPTNSTFRARAFINEGMGNAAGWFVESYLGPAPTQSPVLSISMSNALPLLSLTGDLGRPYLLLYSASLGPAAQWQPLWPLLLTNNPQNYPDPSATGMNRRFYRLLLNQ